ncbi:unnamed protein product [Cuscuta epithymum]|uniref:Uncharacterized protein n=1 Tax=Cuscuta epithymum TaxID=186058 RepID=A0AAV0EGV4_9ASTE|nr:unnamed protein product [Cuscuta epithymum]
MSSNCTYGWDFSTSTWGCIERQAHLDEWKEVDPDLKQLGRVLADQFPDPPKDTVKTMADGYGDVVDFVRCEPPEDERDPDFVRLAPPGTRGRRRLTKRFLEADRRRPKKGVPDYGPYGNYIPKAPTFSPFQPTFSPA